MAYSQRVPFTLMVSVKRIAADRLAMSPVIKVGELWPHATGVNQNPVGRYEPIGVRTLVISGQTWPRPDRIVNQ